MIESKIDKYYPFLGGALFAFAYVGVFLFYPKIALSKGFRDIFIAAITVNAISIGFLATAKAILISIQGSKIVRWMKETGAYDTTIQYFMSALFLSMLCAVWSMFLLLLDFADPIKYIIFFIALWVLLFVWSMLATYRIIAIFSKVLLKS
jgi:hypothetical protein